MRPDLQDGRGLRRSAGAASRHRAAPVQHRDARRHRSSSARPSTSAARRAALRTPTPEKGEHTARCSPNSATTRRRQICATCTCSGAAPAHPQGRAHDDMRTGIDTGTEKMLAHVDGGIGWMTYNNPARHNAMSVDMQIAVPRRSSPRSRPTTEVHVIVVARRRRARRSSPAPTSPSSTRSAPPSGPRRVRRGARERACGRGANVAKPTIAMIRATASAAGSTALRPTSASRPTTPASACRPRSSASATRYQRREAPGRFWSVRPFGQGDLLLRPRQFDADEALAMGLVNRVGPDRRRSKPTCATMRADRRERAAHGQRRQALRQRICQGSEKRDLAACQAAVDPCFASADYVEGRRPSWRSENPCSGGYKQLARWWMASRTFLLSIKVLFK